MRPTAAVAGAAVALACLSGCGSASPGLSAQASQHLQAQVQAIGAAAAAGNPAEAAADLARLRTEVTQLRAAGQISSSRSAAILTAASQVQGQLGAIPTTTTSTTSTTSTTTTTTTTVPPPQPKHGPDGGSHPGPGGGHGGDH